MKNNPFQLMKVIIASVSALVILFIVITIAGAAAYSVCVAEDYFHAVKINAFNDSFPHYMKVSVLYAISEYFRWQGTYSAMFIQSVFSCLNNFGMPFLRIVMIANTICFFASWIMLLFVVMMPLKENWVKFVVCAASCYLLISYESYSEIFFWYSGAVSYSVPLFFLFVGLSLIFISDRRGSIGCSIGAAFCGVIAMGGAMMVGGLGCYTCLLLVVYFLLRDKKLTVRHLVVFLIWVSAALVNAVAPGNFKRAAIYESDGIHPVSAIVNAIDICIRQWEYFLTSTDIVCVILLLIICGYVMFHYSGQIRLRPHIVIGILGLFTPVVTTFPVTLGYSASDITNRCLFMVDLAIMGYTVYLSVLSGAILHMLYCRLTEGKQYRKVIGYIPAAVIACMAVVISLTDGFGLKDNKVFQISSGLLRGDYKAYYESYISFTDSLSKYEQHADVVIPKEEIPVEIPDSYPFYISTDKDFWVNIFVADYYDFNSIATDRE